ncbi:hypothetical protein T492DRAFT_847869 [Pavlovales sp. CCMP2436]|nr:hypothetical protein T492DRAFT_847869 [Pavlovales sp. CCMP2436]
MRGAPWHGAAVPCLCVTPNLCGHWSTIHMASPALIKAAEELARAALDESKATMALVEATTISDKKDDAVLASNALVLKEFQLQRTSARQDARIQRLQWGLSNSSIGSFNQNDGYGQWAKSSADVVTSTLLIFMAEKGCLPGKMFLVPEGGTNDYHQAAPFILEDALPKELYDQIHKLVGEKPNVVIQENGTNAYFMPVIYFLLTFPITLLLITVGRGIELSAVYSSSHI